jgi:hypothetical protein
MGSAIGAWSRGPRPPPRQGCRTGLVDQPPRSPGDSWDIQVAGDVHVGLRRVSPPRRYSEPKRQTRAVASRAWALRRVHPTRLPTSSPLSPTAVSLRISPGAPGARSPPGGSFATSFDSMGFPTSCISPEVSRRRIHRKPAPSLSYYTDDSLALTQDFITAGVRRIAFSSTAAVYGFPRTPRP